MCSFFIPFFKLHTYYRKQHLAFERQQLFLFDLNNLLLSARFISAGSCYRSRCYVQKMQVFFSFSFASFTRCVRVRWTHLLFLLNANQQTNSHLVCFPHLNVSADLFNIKNYVFSQCVLFFGCVEFADGAAGVPFCPSTHYGHNNMETGLSHLFASFALPFSLFLSFI